MDSSRREFLKKSAATAAMGAVGMTIAAEDANAAAAAEKGGDGIKQFVDSAVPDAALWSQPKKTK